MSFYHACELLCSPGNESNETIKKLINNTNLNNRTDASRNTLLHLAIKVGNHEIMQHLLDSDYNVNAENDLGQTPLLLCFETEFLCPRVVGVLLKAGASIYKKDKFGKSPFETVDSNEWLSENIEKIEIYKMFLEKAKDFDDFQLLKTGDEQFIKILLQTDIDMTMTDQYGRTLVHQLAQNSNPGIITLLRGKNFDVNVRDCFGRTPLTCAATISVADTIKFLIDEGADIDSSDNRKRTALYIAYRRFSIHGDNEKCVQILLERGANAQVEIAASQPLTIFDIISEYCDLFVTSIVKEELILAHLALQERNGIGLTQLISSKIESCSKFVTCFEHCKRELSRIIYRSITLYDILTASERKFEDYLRNKEMVSRLGAFRTVGYFDEILRKRLDKAALTIKLKKTAALNICEVMNIEYNSYPYIADKIVGYLDEKDIDVSF